ncbi:NusG domain II-containing protein [Aromatoleum diolicum]|uniref:NusG domain-containing protein n=1 Tax=Aromatoleum diolicum TaxID=75796 RepID=A0ABX1QFQ5_9RHOO|nr:hypothetical protein [Aromatoleum diolicum]
MKARLAEWIALLRPGDYVMLLGAVVVCVLSALALWRGGAPDKAVVRAGGKVFAEVPLSRAQVVEVPGPLGVTRIEIEPGRARVASDPGPRQYCVRQGWLKRSGAVAICAPNQVSLSLNGGSADYDSLNY